MRCAVRRGDARLRALVAILDEDRFPMAETWRLVAAAAESKGLLRPSYPLVRRLVRAERLRRRRRAELRAVALDAAWTILVGRVPNAPWTIDRLIEAHRRLAAAEACVSETQAPHGGVSSPDGSSGRGP